MRAAIGILCGGESRRMGQDKAGLLWHGRTMIEHMVAEMGSTGREVLVSVASMKDCVKELPARIVPDIREGCGPLGGIYSVLKASETDAVFFCAVDMPFVTGQTVEYLERFLDSDHDGVIFADGERLHPLCGIYKKSIIPVIEGRLDAGDYRVRKLPEVCRIRQVALSLSPLSERTLWNVNTPEEYARAVHSTGSD